MPARRGRWEARFRVPSLKPLRAELLTVLEDSLEAGAASLAADGRIVDQSPGFGRLLGAAPGERLEELLAGERPGALAAGLAAVAAGEPERALPVRAVRDRLRRLFELRLRRTTDATGPIEAVIRDRSELDRIERHLLDSERLRLIGEMVLECSAELGRQLAVIDRISQRPGSPGSDELAELRRSCEEARSLVLRLQTFASSPEPGPGQELLDPRDLLADALEFTRLRWQREAAEAGVSIEVEADLQPAGGVRGQRADLRHAVTSLIVGALDAMPQSGRLRVGCRRDGGHALLEVANRGAIVAADPKRATEEPLSAAAGERPLGLDLSIVNEIVARHGGSLQARSSPERGSAFEIRLPLAGRAPRPSAPQPVAAADESKPGRILLVEDNEPLRRLVARALRAEGHEVLESGSTEEAEQIAVCLDSLDLMVVDVSLPGRSGLELISSLRARGYDAPVLVMTAWGVDLRSAGVARVLTKPFSTDTMRRSVRELLDRSAPAR